MGRPFKFKCIDEKDLARDLAKLFDNFDNSMKFKQQIGALELRKAKDLSLGRIDDIQFNFSKRKLKKIKKLF